MWKKLVLATFLLLGVNLIFAQYKVKPNGNGNGKTWQNAASLQMALSMSQSGAEIWLQEGTYYPVQCNPCTETDRKISFVIPNGVRIYGGFAGNETNKEQRNWQANKTRLSGDIDQDNSSRNNSFSVVFTNNVGNLTVLDGVIISDGNAQGNTASNEAPMVSGGGWYNGSIGTLESNPQIINCTFENNAADGFGGAMYNMGAFEGICLPFYKNCIFKNNQSKYDGGAIYSNGSFGGNCNFILEDCLFENNFAGSEIGSGGALFNNGIEGVCNPKIRNCKFDYQSASLHGGAIYNQGKSGEASPIFNNCVFNKNKAEQGGAMYNLGAKIGGNSSPFMTNCTFYGNVAKDYGGAITVNGDLGGTSEPVFRNCIFSNNVGQIEGDLFYLINGHPFLEYCLVDKSNCIQLRTALGNQSRVDCGSGMIYNKPPKFQNPANGDLKIKHNSAALDSGNPDFISLNVDINNNSRSLLENIDIGAYEYDGSPPTKLDTFHTDSNDDYVSINWIYGREYEMSGCEIQRGRDSFNFETIAWVPSIGNNPNGQFYQAFDVPPQRGETYTYRLHCFEKDSCDQYFGLDTAFVRPNEILTKAYPIPATTSTNLKVYFPRDNGQNRLRVVLVDYVGKAVIENEEISPGKGWTSYQYDVTQFCSGIYYFHIYANKEKFIIPVIVSKL